MSKYIFFLIALSILTGYAAPIYYRSYEADKLVKKLYQRLGHNKQAEIGTKLQTKVEKTLLSDYVYFGYDDGVRESYSGSSELLEKYDMHDSTKWTLGGTYVVKKFYKEHQEGIILVYKGGLYFIFQFVVLSWFLIMIILSMFLCFSYFNRKEILSFFHADFHEISQDLRLDEKAQFKIRSAATVGLLLGKKLEQDFTPRLKDLVDLWIRFFATNIRVRKDFNFDPDLIIHDQPLSIIVTNFIKNAVKHTTKPYLKLTIKQKEHTIFFKITNFTERRATIEEQRAIAGKTKRNGLKIVRKFLNYMNAEPYETEFLDSETSFYFEIKTKSIKSELKEPDWINPKRVAVADDNPEILKKLELELADQGFKVFSFSHIDDLYFSFRKSPDVFDAIILDRKGNEYIEKRHWDTVDEDTPTYFRGLGFEGPIYLLTVSGEQIKIKGFNRVLAKGFSHNWRSIIGGDLA